MPNISLEKNKQTTNGLNLFPVTEKDFFFFLLSVKCVSCTSKSVRIWYKLECTKYSTGVILHHWIQRNYCQWHKWRAGIQVDFPFAVVSIAVPYELCTNETKPTKQTKTKKGHRTFKRKLKTWFQNNLLWHQEYRIMAFRGRTKWESFV